MLLTLKEASKWASEFLNKNVTTANISYLIQYGHIESVLKNGSRMIPSGNLESYYAHSNREKRWKKEIGDDLNWTLSFEKIKESETTKHVHRLHPYKGKFIPQLVAYFLDSHTDDFKKDLYFQEGDIILDPFCGSGTTLVQANELGMHTVGIDISKFNAFISNTKLGQYNYHRLYEHSKEITAALRTYVSKSGIEEFEARLSGTLSEFNNIHFPISFKRQVRLGEIDQKEYGAKMEADFSDTYLKLVREYKIDIKMSEDSTRFLKKWYLPGVRAEIEFVYSKIQKIEDSELQNALMLILSRTIRSCRATTHADLGTLREPTTTTYYCRKHGKMCKPLFSILGWWDRYCKDSIERWNEFSKLRTETFQHCIAGDSRTIDILAMLRRVNPHFAEHAEKKRIKGIFTSPPYVGLINYHDQHAYAYDLFGFDRKDELEIGPLFMGKGKDAREAYIQGIAEVFKNCKRFLVDDYNVFIVANDKFNMYPTIAELAGMQIVNQHKRPVLNRTEKNRGAAYSETIFHLKDKDSDL